jgi:hypothetical protein
VKDAAEDLPPATFPRQPRTRAAGWGTWQHLCFGGPSAKRGHAEVVALLQAHVESASRARVHVRGLASRPWERLFVARVHVALNAARPVWTLSYVYTKNSVLTSTMASATSANYHATGLPSRGPKQGREPALAFQNTRQASGLWKVRSDDNRWGSARVHQRVQYLIVICRVELCGERAALDSLPRRACSYAVCTDLGEHPGREVLHYVTAATAVDGNSFAQARSRGRHIRGKSGRVPARIQRARIHSTCNAEGGGGDGSVKDTAGGFAAGGVSTQAPQARLAAGPHG